MKQILFASLLTGASLCTGLAQAGSYDATTDFQLVNNPSAVWSYGYSHLDLDNYALTLFDQVSGSGWQKAGYVSLGTPSVWKNMSASWQSGAAPGQLAMHPGPAGFGDYAILRFTAPEDGKYDVTGQFFAGDNGSMSGAIVLDGHATAPLQFFASTSDQSLFAPLALQMRGGETLDFVVGNNGSFYYGTTPLSVTINGVPAIPEADGYAMLLAGLAMLELLRRRAGP